MYRATVLIILAIAFIIAPISVHAGTYLCVSQDGLEPGMYNDQTVCLGFSGSDIPQDGKDAQLKNLTANVLVEEKSYKIRLSYDDGGFDNSAVIMLDEYSTRCLTYNKSLKKIKGGPVTWNTCDSADPEQHWNLESLNKGELRPYLRTDYCVLPALCKEVQAPNQPIGFRCEADGPFSVVTGAIQPTSGYFLKTFPCVDADSTIFKYQSFDEIQVDETEFPSESPTFSPSISPTESPTESPSLMPTRSPTIVTESPTNKPTGGPTGIPTLSPTFAPTLEPTNIPTDTPTLEPTDIPVEEPTTAPTLEPIAEPTEAPTLEPTNIPTDSPTFAPTLTPIIDGERTVAPADGNIRSEDPTLRNPPALLNTDQGSVALNWIMNILYAIALFLTLLCSTLGFAYPQLRQAIKTATRGNDCMNILIGLDSHYILLLGQVLIGGAAMELEYIPETIRSFLGSFSWFAASINIGMFSKPETTVADNGRRLDENTFSLSGMDLFIIRDAKLYPSDYFANTVALVAIIYAVAIVLAGIFRLIRSTLFKKDEKTPEDHIEDATDSGYAVQQLKWSMVEFILAVLNRVFYYTAFPLLLASFYQFSFVSRVRQPNSKDYGFTAFAAIIVFLYITWCGVLYQKVHQFTKKSWTDYVQHPVLKRYGFILIGYRFEARQFWIARFVHILLNTVIIANMRGTGATQPVLFFLLQIIYGILLIVVKPHPFRYNLSPLVTNILYSIVAGIFIGFTKSGDHDAKSNMAIALASILIIVMVLLMFGKAIPTLCLNTKKEMRGRLSAAPSTDSIDEMKVAYDPPMEEKEIIKPESPVNDPTAIADEENVMVKLSPPENHGQTAETEATMMRCGSDDTIRTEYIIGTAGTTAGSPTGEGHLAQV